MHNHHVVPRSRGGTKTVPLCEGCHGKAHGLDEKTWTDHGKLTRAGLARAKVRGVKLGRPCKTFDVEEASRRLAEGSTQAATALAMGVSIPTLRSGLARAEGLQ